ncbi:MAG: hypothetical protein R3C68_00645 [Myxococcota bacterium]
MCWTMGRQEVLAWTMPARSSLIVDAPFSVGLSVLVETAHAKKLRCLLALIAVAASKRPALFGLITKFPLRTCLTHLSKRLTPSILTVYRFRTIFVHPKGIFLAGHVTPGEVLGIDVSRLFFRSIELDNHGFAINSTTFFRFTDMPVHASICLDAGSVYPRTCSRRLSGLAKGSLCPSGGDATIFSTSIW